ncbi:MAG: arginine--tRNA ligase [Chloroflexota bacterium]|nr:arginine--tRNA ligase [Chloroflexota bacterium]
MHVRDLVTARVNEALSKAQDSQTLPTVPAPAGIVERPQNPEHGDFASSAPLKLARTMRMRPMDIAEAIAQCVATDSEIATVEIAPPGFINFTLSPAWLQQQVETILEAGASFGSTNTGAGKRVQVEFVSVNPTGPVHVGHARGAVIGSVLASALGAAGYDVSREYYLNDAGSQIELFHQSLFARYAQALGKDVELPAGGYQGDYMVELGAELAQSHGDSFLQMPEDEGVRGIGDIGIGRMIDSIRDDLGALRVEFDVWFSEKSLFEDSDYDTAMRMLREGGHVTQREGATWFVSTALGEDKDNVLIRSNGLPTYFASDAAYHYNKFLVRGFDRVTDIWGADHQGHVNRVKAVVGAMGVDPERLNIIIGQMVALKRGGESVRASKRTGDIITLRELVDEVGPDACRYFFLARSAEAQMEFDLELATKESQDNPVYYLQYAHARIAGILRNASDRGLDFTEGNVGLLGEPEELALVRQLLLLPEIVDTIAETMEPHRLPHYTLELATAFHWFYDQCRVISDDEALSKARLKLVEASRIGLARCLSLMGMAAPEQM